MSPRMRHSLAWVLLAASVATSLSMIGILGLIIVGASSSWLAVLGQFTLVALCVCALCASVLLVLLGGRWARLAGGAAMIFAAIMAVFEVVSARLSDVFQMSILFATIFAFSSVGLPVLSLLVAYHGFRVAANHLRRNGEADSVRGHDGGDLSVGA